jgi:radical SAM protein with 4Fe4S-binding SPASM domain
MKENIDEIEDFLRLAHHCGIQSVRFMRLLSNWQSLRGVRLKDRDFVFRYVEQNSRKVRDEFLKRLPDYQDLSNELGITVEFGSFHNRTEGPHPNPVKEIVNTITTGLYGNGLFPLIRVKGACLAPWIGQLVVNQKGDVRLCCATTYTLGNLRESTLSEIWNSDRMKAIRKAFAEGRNPRVCGYCKGFYFGNYPNNAFVGIER